MIKYISITLVAIISITVIILTTGSYQSHQFSKQHNFVGIVGGHIYVDNSSGKPVTPRDLQIMWQGLYRGAPGPFLEAGRFIIRRIEIIEGGTRQDQECGSYKIKLYSFFNKLFEIVETNYPCA